MANLEEHNTRCFQEAASTVTDILHTIKNEAERWMLAGAKKNLECLLSRE
jgi:hypothetical protein